jgi:PEP-CTERM motif.
MNPLVRTSKHLGAIAVAAALFTGSASALSINVVNYSFELDNAGGAGGVVQSVPTGWTQYNRVGGSDIGSQNPNNSQFPINNPLASPAQGNQFAYINTFDNNPGGISGIYQSVGALQPNTIYTLTVAIGSRADRINTAGTISLINGLNPITGTILATGGGLPATQGTWEDYTISFQTGASVDGMLTIALSSVAAGTIQADFDNVRLDAVAVPEPELYGLALAGLIGVIVWRRRARRPAMQ